MAAAPPLVPKALTYAELRQRELELHEERVGRVYAHWRAEELLGRHGGAYAYRAVCTECGAQELFGATDLLAGRPCLECFAGIPDGSLDRRSWRELVRQAAAPRLDPDAPWKEDGACRAWVALNGEGSSLEVIGRAMGISHQRVSQLEAAALAKLRDAMAQAGYGPDNELVRAWGRITHHRPPED